MAVKIKLMRLGKIREPYYRIVVADARTRRGGRAIETIGKYHPKREPSFIEVDSVRAQYWLGVGAQPTDPVKNILEITGDWQKFKGLPGQEGTLRHPKPPVDKLARFQAALAEAGGELTTDATTPRKKTTDRRPKQAPAADKPADAAADKPADAAADKPADAAADKPADAAAAEAAPSEDATATPEAPAAADSKADTPAAAPAAAEGGT